MRVFRVFRYIYPTLRFSLTAQISAVAVIYDEIFSRRVEATAFATSGKRPGEARRTKRDADKNQYLFRFFHITFRKHPFLFAAAKRKQGLVFFYFLFLSV